MQRSCTWDRSLANCNQNIGEKAKHDACYTRTWKSVQSLKQRVNWMGRRAFGKSVQNEARHHVLTLHLECYIYIYIYIERLQFSTYVFGSWKCAKRLNGTSVLKDFMHKHNGTHTHTHASKVQRQNLHDQVNFIIILILRKWYCFLMTILHCL